MKTIFYLISFYSIPLMSFGFMSLLSTLLSYCQILFMVGHQYNIEVASIFFLNDDLLYKLHVFCCTLQHDDFYSVYYSNVSKKTD